MTGIGEIPGEWAVVRIGDICKVVTGGTPSTMHPEYFGGTIKWLKSGDIKELYIYDTEEKITQSGIENSNAKIHPPGTVAIALSGRGQTRGKTAIIKRPMACSQSVAIMIPNSELVPEYLHYNLSNRYLEIRNLTGHYDRSGLNLAIVSNINIPLPPLPEQRRIAEVLGTVDSAIQKVGGAIESTERLKKGMMQRLLTRGIGHERFKESDVGRVPEEWGVSRLGDVCNHRSEITMPSGKGENKFVGLEHINPGELKIHTYQLDTDVKSSKFRFRRGDILYGKLRPYLDKAVIADFDGICSTDLLVLTNAENRALAEFLIYLIHSNQFIQNSISATSGTNHPRTSWKEISKFKFGLPPLSEQRRIAEILSAADRKLELERRRKEKLERVKKGLMNELLTGRKRVKIRN